MNTIDRSHPIAVRLLAAMAKDDGWSARWLGNLDWLNHESGLIVHIVREWTQYYELDPEPPHLVIYTASTTFVDLPLLHTPCPRWPWQPRSVVNPADPYLVAFDRLSAVTQAAALNDLLPA